MDKIFKLLRKIRRSDRLAIINAMELVEENSLDELDIKKLAGRKDLFRVRVGRYRIIYMKGEKNIILDVRERDNKTYKNI